MKLEKEYKHQRDEAESARKALAEKRDQAIAEQKAAKDSADEMKTVLAFFQGKGLSAGRSVGWSGGQGKDVTLRKAVDSAASKIVEAFADRPLAEASVREILAMTYLDLEEPALAVTEYERALALREALQREEHTDTVACRNLLANAYRLADRPREADRLYERDNHSITHASALAIRGAMLLARKQPVDAEKILRECVAIRQKIQPGNWTTFEAKSLLGQALLEQKKYTVAEPLLQSGYQGMKEREAKIPSREKQCLPKAWNAWCVYTKPGARMKKRLGGERK